MSGRLGASDMADMADMADMTVGGLSVEARPMLRPIGISPAPWQPKAPDKALLAHKWPPSDAGEWEQAPADTVFSREAWTPDYFSQVVLAKFAQMNQWHGFETELSKILEEADVSAELRHLAGLMNYRQGLQSEALTESSDILSYFQGVFTFKRSSHPRTYDLMHVALRVARFQAMHYKAIFSRPRPSQLSPVLMPPNDPPGHASFPSGHATEANLIALMLAKVIPGSGDPFHRLAERIARNREVFGYHYPSDSEAGRVLAEKTSDLLKNCPIVERLMTEAKREWTDVNRLNVEPDPVAAA